MAVSVSVDGPVMGWRPVQGEPRLSPNDSWDRLQPRRDPELDKVGIKYGWIGLG